jgi:tetraacyldisaccharide 4'-kinase
VRLSSQRPTLETVIVRAWMQRGPLACMLWPLSIAFSAVVALRRRLFAAGILKSVRLPVPVVVVGNIFIGGTGKTPLTIWLVQALRQAGYVPGVISRGYGAHADTVRPVTAASLPREVGDEPVLIASRAGCPVMVGRNRVAAAQALLAAHPEVNLIVSDDGLQHYALQRNVEIVLCDDRGNGNGWLLPAGPLREPASRPRDFTVVNGSPANGPPGAARMRLEGEVAERLSDRGRRLDLRALATMHGVQGRGGAPPRILAAAGIGNPGRFFAMLRAAGVQFDEMPLPDHYDYAANPFADAQADIILITEKDAVKCGRSDEIKNDARLWVVPVAASLDGALAEKIVEKCRGFPTA